MHHSHSEGPSLGTKGRAGPDQLLGSPCSLCFLSSGCTVESDIRPGTTEQTVSPTLRSTTMAPKSQFLSNRGRGRRGTAHNEPLPRDASASRMPSTSNRQRTTEDNAASPTEGFDGQTGHTGRGVAVAYSALRFILYPSQSRTAHAATFGSSRAHAHGRCACAHVIGFFRRPPWREREGPRMLSK